MDDGVEKGTIIECGLSRSTSYVFDKKNHCHEKKMTKGFYKEIKKNDHCIYDKDTAMRRSILNEVSISTESFA